MPKNKEFIDSGRRKMSGEAYLGQDKQEIDVSKLSPKQQLQFARQAQKGTSGVSKPKGIASGLRGDVSQMLGQAAGTVQNMYAGNVVTANPQQMRGMRFDPRTRGGSKAAATPDKPQAQAPVRSGSVQEPTGFSRGGRGGADNRVGGPQGHVYGGGMSGYSNQGMDDSDISQARAAQARSGAFQRRIGTEMFTGTAGKSALKTGAMGIALKALGIPGKMIASLLPGMFMKGVFSPSSAATVGRAMWGGRQTMKAYEKAMGRPANMDDKNLQEKLAEAHGLDDKGKQAYFEGMKADEDWKEKGILPELTPGLAPEDQYTPDQLEAYDKQQADLAREKEALEQAKKQTQTPTTPPPVDQWAYNSDMGDGGGRSPGLGDYGAPDTGGAYGGGYDSLGSSDDIMGGYGGGGGGMSTDG